MIEKLKLQEKTSPERKKIINQFEEDLGEALSAIGVLDKLEQEDRSYAEKAQEAAIKIHNVAAELIKRADGREVVIANEKNPEVHLVMRYKEGPNGPDDTIWLEEVTDVSSRISKEEEDDDVFKKIHHHRLAVNPKDNLEALAVSAFTQNKKMVAEREAKFEAPVFSKDSDLAKPEEAQALFGEYKEEMKMKLQSSVH